MSAEDVEHYKVQFVTAYNENKGIKLVKRFQSGNCCIALKGGQKFTIAGSQFGYQFPATGQGQIACNPKGGYLQSSYQFYKTPSLKMSMSFDGKAVCSTNANPGLYFRVKKVDPVKQLRDLLPSKVHFGINNADKKPVGGWKLMTIKDFQDYKKQFVDYYNIHKGLKPTGGFKTRNCCFTVGKENPSDPTEMLVISKTKYEFQFPSQGGTIKCNPDGGYNTDQYYTFYGVDRLTMLNDFTTKSGCEAGGNPGVFMLQPEVIYHAFGVFDASKSPGDGWRIMTADDFNINKQQFIIHYNANKGLNMIKNFKSGNCCFAVKGGKKLVISGTKFDYQFPADTNGVLRCNPPNGYIHDTYKFMGVGKLSMKQTFSAKAGCATKNNPAVFIKDALAVQKEFGLFSLNPNKAQAEQLKAGGWKILSPVALEQHKIQFIQQYNALGGLTVIKSFSSIDCCFALEGGNKLAISETADGYQTPLDADGNLKCNPALPYKKGAHYRFFQAKQLAYHQTFTEVKACETGNNPAIYIRDVNRKVAPTSAPTHPPTVATVHCTVTDWTTWSTCSKTCGAGSAMRTRKVKKAGKDARCPALKETKKCLVDECASHCKVTAWKKWGKCNAKCGGGVMLRTRTVDAQPNRFGNMCPHLSETKACNAAPCPIHCSVSAWSTWSDCNAECGGGYQLRARNVKVAAEFMGNKCPHLDEKKDCNIEKCPVHCTVTKWSSWTSCTKMCGGGTQTRTRKVNLPAKFEGDPCPSLKEIKNCNSVACPTPAPTPLPECAEGEEFLGGKCQMCKEDFFKARYGPGLCAKCPAGTWTDMEVGSIECHCKPTDCEVSTYGIWSKCTKSCNGGIRKRQRTITKKANECGMPCPHLQEVGHCNMDVPCPIDCELTKFGKWEGCKKSCGNGLSFRHRKVKKLHAHGGKPCEMLVDSKQCNTHACPRDCIASTWSKWGKCSTTCGKGTKYKKRKVVTHTAFGGRGCPTLSANAHCNLGPCPIHCTTSPWTLYSTCTKTCGGGVHKRTRIVLHKAHHGGVQCPTLSETSACNQRACPCPAGQFHPDPLKAKCISCLAGTFKADGSAFGCTTCTEGTWSPTGAKKCSACARGTFNPSKGATECMKCQAGEFSLLGEKACRKCKAGMYTQRTGSDECVQCKPGTFSAQGWSKCSACVAGTYQDITGQDKCVNCPAGTVSGKGAHACTKCGPGTFQDKKGQKKCDTCAAGTFSLYAFATCHAKSKCTANQWMVEDAKGIRDRVCADFTVCERAEYEVKRPTANSDRVCAAHSKCARDHWEVKPPSMKKDRECRQFTPCSKDEYEMIKAVEAPYATMDRVCTLLTTCSPDQYQTVASTRTSDRTCGKLQSCSVGHYRAGFHATGEGKCAACPDGTFKDKKGLYDTSCQPYNKCDPSTEFERVAPTSTADRICSPQTVCAKNQFVKKAASTGTDKVCADVTICRTDQFERQPPTANTDRICQNVKRCKPVEFVKIAATKTTDVVCAKFEACAAGTFRYGNDATNEGKCQKCGEGTYKDIVGDFTTECKDAIICQGDEYEFEKPTTTSDRMCAAKKVCAHNEYIFKRASSASNTVCKKFKGCPAGTERRGHSGKSAGKCVKCGKVTFKTVVGSYDTRCDFVTACQDGEYEFAKPTHMSDTVCNLHTKCSATEYESKAPTKQTDRVCRSHGVCPSDQFESKPPTKNADRVCTELSICRESQFEAKKPVSDSAGQFVKDRVCTNLPSCPVGKYLTGFSESSGGSCNSCPPGSFKDTEGHYYSRCKRHSKCKKGAYFQAKAPTRTNDRICKALTVCEGSEHESAAPKWNTDRDCTTTTVCAHDQYESKASTSSSNRECTKMTVCSDDEFQARAPSTVTDRVCQKHEICQHGFYLDSFSAEEAGKCTKCPPGTFKSKKGTHATKCEYAKVCKYHPEADHSEYEFQTSTHTVDTVCKDLTMCKDSQYQSNPPALTSDRECKVETKCSTNEYEVFPASSTTDRICDKHRSCQEGYYREGFSKSKPGKCHSCPEGYFKSSIGRFDTKCTRFTECDGATHYTVKHGTTTQDAMCEPYTVCGKHEFQVKSATQISDRECDTATVCASNHYVSRAATKTSDRKCSVLQPCPAGQHRKGATATKSGECVSCEKGAFKATTGKFNTKCTVVKTCAKDSYSTKAPTPTSDRLCMAATTCLKSQFASTALSASADRKCSEHNACPKGFERTGATSTSAGECTACAKGTFKATSGEYDTKCVAVTHCDLWKNYEHKKATTTSDLVCKPLTKCGHSEYEHTSRTATSDRLCASHSQCAANHYQVKAATKTSDRLCRVLTVCKKGEYEKTKPFIGTALHAVSDRECTAIGACPTGSFRTDYSFTKPGVCSRCPAGTYKASTGTYTTKCVKVSQCKASVTYEAGSASTGADRVCKPVTKCAKNEYEARGPTLSSDTRCIVLTRCTDTEYEAVAATKIADRVCAALNPCPRGHYRVGYSQKSAGKCATCKQNTFKDTIGSFDTKCTHATRCTYGATYQAAPSSTTSDFECKPITKCSASEYEANGFTKNADRECRSHSTCSGAHWMSKPATTKTDRQCTALTKCTSGQYQYKPPTATSDRQCAFISTCYAGFYKRGYSSKSEGICSPCTPGSFKSTVGSYNTKCSKLTTCEQGRSYETKEPTVKTDRECAEVTQCEYYEYETQAPTLNSDRKCAKLSQCKDTEYEKFAPTKTSDRTCVKHDACTTGFYLKAYSATEAGTCNKCPRSMFKSKHGTYATRCMFWSDCHSDEFTYKAPTAYSDRVCRKLTKCGGSEYESASATSTSDRTCSAHTACTPGHYETKKATKKADRQCKALTNCVVNFCDKAGHCTGEYESTTATNSSDRVCTALKECAEGHELAGYNTGSRRTSPGKCQVCKAGHFKPSIGDYATKCKPATKCSKDQYQTWSSTDIADTVCAKLQICASDEYEFRATTATSDRECAKLTVCHSSQYAATQPTATSDRTCANVKACDSGSMRTGYNSNSPGKCTRCPKDTFKRTTGIYSSSCKWHTKCEVNEFESTAPNHKSDRQCLKLAVCSDSEYEMVSPTDSSDRQCSALTKCGAGQYEKQAPTETSDRICMDIKPCKAGLFRAGSSQFSGGRCIACAPNTYKNSFGHYTTQCRKHSMCDYELEFEAGGASARSDRLCKPISVCGKSEYETKLPSRTSDRQCATHTQCSKDHWVKKRASRKVDRQCAPHLPCMQGRYRTNFNEFSSGDCVACPEETFKTESFIEIDAKTFMPVVSSYKTQCKKTTQCVEHKEYEKQAATTSSDRVCGKLTQCKPYSEYEATPATTNSDRACAPVFSCPSGRVRVGHGRTTGGRCEKCAKGSFKAFDGTYDTACKPFSQCTVGYEIRTPSASNDRVCHAHTKCSKFEYEIKKPTALSDRICASSTRCQSDQWESKPKTGRSDRHCSSITKCDYSAEFELAKPTGTSDRVCKKLTPCSAGKQRTGITETSGGICQACPAETFKPAQKTPSFRSMCRKVSICDGSHSHQSFAPTATSDRTCTEHDPCKNWQYEAEAPTHTSNRVCKTITNCKNGQYASQTATKFTDTMCSNIPPCEAGSHRVGYSPNTAGTCKRCLANMFKSSIGTYQSPCTWTTRCDSFQYMAERPTKVSDRMCKAITKCSATEYESKPPTKMTDRVCQSHTKCGQGHFESTAATATTDCKCTQISMCGKDQYTVVQPSKTSDRVCKTYHTCPKGAYLTKWGKHSAGVCHPCAVGTFKNYDGKYSTTCSTVSRCTVGRTYETAAPTAEADRLCIAVKHCASHQFEVVAPTASSDRKCQKISSCAKGQYQAAPPQWNRDRQCATIPSCPAGTYRTAFTRNHKGKCATCPNGTWKSTAGDYLTRCTFASEPCDEFHYELKGPSTIANRKCHTRTLCTGNEYEIKAPTGTSDRRCASHSKCAASHFESKRPTAAGDRECSIITKCDLNQGFYESTAATAVSDRKCSSLNACAKGTFRFGFNSRSAGSCVDCPLGSFKPAMGRWNTHCTRATECDKNHYQTKALTVVSDRKCAKVSKCSAEQYETAQPTIISDRMCVDLTKCSSAQFQALAATKTTDRKCTAVSPCAKGTYRKGYDATSAGKCAACATDTFKARRGKYGTQCLPATVCDKDTQFQSVASTSTSNRVCKPVTECGSHEYEASPKTTTSDRVCRAHTACSPTHFASKPASKTADMQCTELTACSSSQYESQAPVKFCKAGKKCWYKSDRVCINIKPCNAGFQRSLALESSPFKSTGKCVKCPARTYKNKPGKWDLTCNKISTCDATEFERAAPTFTSDRKCTALNVCRTDQFETKPPTSTSDRKCKLLTQCSEFKQHMYESKSPTAFSDRECMPVQPCPKGSMRTAFNIASAGKCTPCKKGAFKASTGLYSDTCAAHIVCKKWQFMTSKGSATKDTICKKLEVCGAEEYESKAPTTTTDRVCSSHSECAESHYEAKAATSKNDRECEKLTTCKKGQFESKAPSATSNRRCTEYTSCDAGSYNRGFNSAKPFAGFNECVKCTWGSFKKTRGSPASRCSKVAQCLQDQSFQFEPPTPTTDRVCKLVTECTSSEFEIAAPTILHDRKCQKLTVCKLSQWQSKASTKTSDRQCTDFKACEGGAELVIERPAMTSGKCRKCTAGTFKPPHGKWDTMCAPFTQCKLNKNYFEHKGTSVQDVRCHDVTICTGTEYEAKEPTLSSDRDCRSHGKCSKHHFQSKAPTATTDRECKLLTTCTKHQFVKIAATETTDRVCEEVTPCPKGKEFRDGKCTGCKEGYFKAHVGTYSDMCQKWQKCAEAFETSKPSATTDRVCKSKTICSHEEYEFKALTSKTDRVCKKLTTCSEHHYEVKAPTDTTDRQCAALTPCNSGQHRVDASKWTAGKCAACSEGTFKAKADHTKCIDWKACDQVKEYQFKAPSTTNDRMCKKMTNCGDTEYESTGPSDTSDRVCSSHDQCSKHHYEVKPPTATSSRVCAALTKCQKHQYVLTVPSKKSDRTCKSYQQCPKGYALLHATKTAPGSCVKCAKGTWLAEHGTYANKCQKVSECATNEYQSMHATYTSDRLCKKKTVCTAHEYVAQNATKTTDRLCNDLTFCSGGEYEAKKPKKTDNVFTSDRVCASAKACASGSFELKAATSDSDRLCKSYTKCSKAQYESRKATKTSDRMCHERAPCGVGFFRSFTKSSDAGICAPCTSGTTFKDAEGTFSTQCKGVSVCDSKSYEMASPTSSSDRICSALTACDSNEYAATPATKTSDRQCKALTVCSHSQFQSKKPAASTDRQCTRYQSCPAGQYRYSYHRLSGGRCRTCPRRYFKPIVGDYTVRCMRASRCKRGQYEKVAATATNDAVCHPITECKGKEYEAGKPTASTDRICATHMRCAAGHFESKAPTALDDRQCSSLTICSKHQYESKAPAKNNDRHCLDIQPCGKGSSRYGYNKKSGGKCYPCPEGTFKDSVGGYKSHCKTVTKCTDHQYNAAKPTTSTDRLCKAVTRCGHSQWTKKDKSTHADRVCAKYDTCPAGQFLAGFKPNSPGKCTPCKAGTFKDHAGSFATVCSATSKCYKGEFELGPATSKSNRKCQKATVCRTTQFELKAPSGAADRKCKTLSRCAPATHYEAKYATATTDRVCKPLRDCKAGEYEVAAATRNSNRVCKPLTVCKATQFEAHPASHDTDRVCSRLSNCGDSEYESKAATASADRVCSSHTHCKSSHYEAKAATKNTDRVCKRATRCSSIQYQFSQHTRSADTICKRYTVCEAHEYQYKAPTKLTDRLCFSHTTCAKDQFEYRASTEYHDRECKRLSVCHHSDYEAVPATTSSDRKCMKLKPCAAGFFRAGHGAHSSGKCAACPTGTFKASTGSVHTKCAAHKVCVKGHQFETKAGTTKADTVCQDIERCGHGEFEATPPTKSANRICKSHGKCSSRHYIFKRATKTSDVECKQLTKCKQGSEYESGSRSAYSDRQCAKIESCKAGFYKKGGSSKSNGVCLPCPVNYFKANTGKWTDTCMKCPKGKGTSGDVGRHNCEHHKQHCTVSKWGPFTACTKSCGTGAQERSRVVTRKAKYGGTKCPPLGSTVKCATKSCPVDCVTTDFGAWTKCSKSCGTGATTRHRKVTTAASFGGRKCPSTVHSKKCNAAPCPVDCKLTKFGKWSTCTRTCGKGQQERRRHIVDPPSYGGLKCKATVQQRDCNTYHCPIDCIVTGWSRWAACSRSCGSGTTRKSRTVTISPKFGGAKCPSVIKLSKPCNRNPCPADCKMSSWTAWTTCTKSCSGGTHLRSRSVVALAAHGGKKCGAPTENKQCNTFVCPVDCVATSRWGAWSTCSRTCGGGKSSKRRVLTTRAAFGGQPCKDDSEVKKCNMQRCGSCSHTKCVYENAPHTKFDQLRLSSKTGFRIRVLHKAEEQNGKKHHCIHNKDTNKCECLCYEQKDEAYWKQRNWGVKMGEQY
jgi:hypothetical protein